MDSRGTYRPRFHGEHTHIVVIGHDLDTHLGGVHGQVVVVVVLVADLDGDSIGRNLL